MDLIERLDKVIEGGFARLVQMGLGPHDHIELLEAYSAALEDVVSRVQYLGNQRIFPFKRVMLTFGASDPDEIPAITQMLSQRRTLVEDVRRKLEEAGCERPALLRVEGHVVAATETVLCGKPYAVSFAPDLPAQPALTLRVLKGLSERRTYVLAHQTVNIGRQEEVLDDRRRLIRRNHVVFREADRGTNVTVSRLHAHITFDPEVGWYRLYDDRSRVGTRISRGDVLLEIPPGGQTGARLRSDDQIHLGEARLNVGVADE